MKHLLQPEFGGMEMREYYAARSIYPTSTDGDTELIRSHLAYHYGKKIAERAAIKPSRGRSYRVSLDGRHSPDDWIAYISNYYDHRDGVAFIQR